MATVILFELPSDRLTARSWLLDHAAMLAIDGKAELKFVGIEQAGPGAPGAETIALEFESTDYASSILSAWQQDAGFPDRMAMRVLQVEAITLADLIFP